MKIKRRDIQIKTKQELEYLRKAAKITVRIFDEIKPMVRPGVSEADIAQAIAKKTREQGLTKAFKTIVAGGPNAAHPHAPITDRKISKNDCVVIDFGVRYRRQRSDMTRTVIVGRPGPGIKKIYNAVRDAQRMGINNIRPGLKINDYVKEVHNSLRDLSLGKYIRHTLGHGIGTRIHEGPKLSERNKRRLKEGMVVTIEPGLYVDGLGGVRIEDMVVINKKGCEVLTRSTSLRVNPEQVSGANAPRGLTK